jgi:hypothetical protein
MILCKSSTDGVGFIVVGVIVGSGRCGAILVLLIVWRFGGVLMCDGGGGERVKREILQEGQGEESHGTYFFKLEEELFVSLTLFFCLFFSLFVYLTLFKSLKSLLSLLKSL